MNDRQYTYEELQQKLAESEALIDALRKHEIDAIIGEKSVAVVRLREVEEQLVEARRTAEERANELEAFSYSVSHDLRAPLLLIKGFSDILLEDYTASLDDTGRGYLKQIITGINKMTALIDDMLELSRISRHDLHKETVDLHRIALEIITEIRQHEPHRDVDIVINNNMTVRADRKLITIALANLIRNAWKFTSKTHHARIEISRTRQNGMTVFYIRDNGAGFDMNQSEKLFGAFQRLHPETEFPGTGVGLAIVKRVIAKHEGRIWPESSPGHGATFYFFIP